MNGIPQDGPERWRYASGVELAAANGEKIESVLRNSDCWAECKPAFDWNMRDYRVAPKAPRVCCASYCDSDNPEDPWGVAYSLSKSKKCHIPLIELTPEVRAALASAGIDYEGKGAA